MKNLKVYRCKDGRWRAAFQDNNGKWVYKSYPRLVMEQHLGRVLASNEDVHHIDGNKDNNDISNLEIKPHGEHQRIHATKYVDQPAVCEVCGSTFIWSGIRQRQYYADIRRGKFRIVTCSWKCSSYYGRLKQLGKI